MSNIKYKNILSNSFLEKIISFLFYYEKEYNKSKIEKTTSNLNVSDLNLEKYNLDKSYYSDLSNLKLQKLLYFLYGYYYGFANKRNFDKKELFSDIKFEAWPYGPVIKEVYDKYNKLFNNFIENDNSSVLEEIKNYFGINGFEKIKNILKYLLDFSAWVLVEISHTTLPWKNTVKNNKYGTEIKIEEIKQFFIDKFEVYEKRID